MYDIVIIGGGPGGYVAAIRGAQLGASVCLIEKDRLGGTCLNYGCIPTKALYRNAEILNTLKHSEEFGINVNGYSIDIEKIHNRKQNVIDTLVSGIAQLIKANSIEYINGTASLVDNKTVNVSLEDGSTNEVKGKNIILATGSVPSVPQVLNTHGIWTSNEILNFKKLPESLAIIGGGVIGMEFASIFNAMGTKVTVIEFLPSIISMVDGDLTKRLMPSMKKRGIDILTSTAVNSIEKTEEGYVVNGSGKKGDIAISVDNVLIATGRRAFYDGLGVLELGIEYDKKGIKVDDDFMTSVESIYAIGDVNGKTMLAHAASWQGERAVEKIMGVSNSTHAKPPIPSCIFIFPEIATVGISEEEAKALGITYKASKFMFGANGKALTLGEPEGLVKVITENRKDKDIIVGVHIMGPHASDLIHEGALAVAGEMRIEDIIHTIHAHPTLSEAFHEASSGIINQAIHMVPSKR